MDLVEHFKENSLYKLQKSGGHNAFDVVEMEAFAGEGPLERRSWSFTWRIWRQGRTTVRVTGMALT